MCAFIDAEHAMDPLYAQRIGVNIDELLVSQPDYGEQALEVADMLVRSGAVDVVAIDSVAALTPRAELEGQMGDQTVGVQARMMSQAMRKLTGNLNRTQTLCVFVNQIREKVGVMFGSPETQPGGRALKFYASQRLDIRRIETLKEGTEAVGNRVRVKVVKNKVAAPFRQAEFDIEFGKGISTAGCLIDLGIEHNVVTKSGSFFSYGDERLGQGRNNAKAYLDEHPEVAKEIEDKIYAALGLDDGPRAADRARGGAHGAADRGARGRRGCGLAGSAGGRATPDATAEAQLQHARDLAFDASRPPRAHRRRGARAPGQARRRRGDGRGGVAELGAGLPRRRRLRRALRRGPADARRPGAGSHRARPAAARESPRECAGRALAGVEHGDELDAALALLRRRFPAPPEDPREARKRARDAGAQGLRARARPRRRPRRHAARRRCLLMKNSASFAPVNRCGTTIRPSERPARKGRERTSKFNVFRCDDSNVLTTSSRPTFETARPGRVARPR